MSDAAILVTSDDFRRLHACAMRARRTSRDAEAADDLLERLQRAVVVEAAELEEPVVGLDAPFVARDLDDGRAAELVIVAPSEADAAAGRVSALAPLGIAVLGRPVGSVAQWRSPVGERRVRIERAEPASGSGARLAEPRVATA